MNTIAVVDIGSNTVKLSVYRWAPDTAPAAIASDSDTVRISHRLSETGVIAPERIATLHDCLHRFEQTAREHGAEVLLAVGTQALRIADNSDAVIRDIQTRTAWRVRILSADEETRLTIDGARPWLAQDAWSVVADVGGASSEIITVTPKGDIWRAGSVALGSGSLFDKEMGASPPPAGTLDRCIGNATAAIGRHDLLPDAVPHLVLPGGTGHYLQALLHAIAPDVPFGPGGIPTLHDWLGQHPASETMARIPVQLDRARVLPASLAIVEALVLRLEPVTLTAIPGGIRDGIARGYCTQT